MSLTSEDTVLSRNLFPATGEHVPPAPARCFGAKRVDVGVEGHPCRHLPPVDPRLLDISWKAFTATIVRSRTSASTSWSTTWKKPSPPSCVGHFFHDSTRLMLPGGVDSRAVDGGNWIELGQKRRSLGGWRRGPSRPGL
ncbi:uncharacterized protein J3R85_007961 [Psidium guajava]|nr:uncharacterized protein J3R85_007961 [Psidium guajava]